MKVDEDGQPMNCNEADILPVTEVVKQLVFLKKILVKEKTKKN